MCTARFLFNSLNHSCLDKIKYLTLKIIIIKFTGSRSGPLKTPKLGFCESSSQKMNVAWQLRVQKSETCANMLGMMFPRNEEIDHTIQFFFVFPSSYFSLTLPFGEGWGVNLIIKSLSRIDN